MGDYVDANGLSLIAQTFAKKNTGTASTAGLTKLYAGTGQNEDGAMTQKAISDALTILGESVADGKASIASAITNKGVTTSSTASFSDMADNIAQIESGVNTDFRITQTVSCTDTYMNTYTIDQDVEMSKCSITSYTDTYMNSNIIDPETDLIIDFNIQILEEV